MMDVSTIRTKKAELEGEITRLISNALNEFEAGVDYELCVTGIAIDMIDVSAFEDAAAGRMRTVLGQAKVTLERV